VGEQGRSERRWIRGRLRSRPRTVDAPEADDAVIEIDPAELSGVFAAPGWLRDLGISAWLLVGIAAALAGAVWLLALTQTIVIPLIVGGIVASVASPVVGWLGRLRVPRALAAVLTLLLIAVIGAALAVMVFAGISDEASDISAQLEGAAQSVQTALQDAGVSSQEAQSVKDGLKDTLSSGFHAIMDGVVAGISALGSLAVFLSFTLLITFFLLKDGPQLKSFVGSHLGVPAAVGETILGRTAGSLQSYFFGMTIVSAFSATIVGIGCVIFDVDLVGTIVAVTFLGGYVPYLGAWLAGFFAVAMALGSAGTDAAIGIAVISLLANGILQQMVQPIAYGATLGLHPLAVLVVTIAGGSLFGAIGLILAAPLLSAAVKISGDLERARAAEATAAEPPPAKPPPAAPPEAAPA
jgi:predicted PurR-regulated permease PerM